MLTDTIVEEEFEIKEEEPWYDKQDLEHGTISFSVFVSEPWMIKGHINHFSNVENNQILKYEQSDT